MARQKNDQTPLGELLTKARLEKRLSRAGVAKETGITEASLVRYEKAGIEADGQFPPSPKLAALCFFLGIPPIKALFGCLNYPDFWKYKGETWESDVMHHPDHDFLGDEYIDLLKENRRLRAFIKLLLDPNDAKGEEYFFWMKKEVQQIFDKRFEIEERWEREGNIELYLDTLRYPGIPSERWHEVYPDRPCPYAPKEENGPDHLTPDPSRSNSTTNHPEADPTASNSQKKGTD